MPNKTTSINESLLEFFRDAARKDSSVLGNIQQFNNFDVNSNQWSFTLIDLYSFLQDYNSEFQNIDFNNFRKTLYNSPINHEVKKFGAEVLVKTNEGHVDRSTYVLIWH